MRPVLGRGLSRHPLADSVSCDFIWFVLTRDFVVVTDWKMLRG
jgi:hypothetical protein